MQSASCNRHSQPHPSPSCQGCPGHQSAFQLSVSTVNSRQKSLDWRSPLPSEGGVDTVKVGLARVPLQGAQNTWHIWPPSARTSQRTGCRWCWGRCSPWTSSLAFHTMTGANMSTPRTPSTMPLLSCFNVDTNSSCTNIFDISTVSAAVPVQEPRNSHRKCSDHLCQCRSDLHPASIASSCLCLMLHRGRCLDHEALDISVEVGVVIVAWRRLCSSHRRLCSQHSRQQEQRNVLENWTLETLNVCCLEVLPRKDLPMCEGTLPLPIPNPVGAPEAASARKFLHDFGAWAQNSSTWRPCKTSCKLGPRTGPRLLLATMLPQRP